MKLRTAKSKARVRAIGVPSPAFKSRVHKGIKRQPRRRKFDP